MKKAAALIAALLLTGLTPNIAYGAKHKSMRMKVGDQRTVRREGLKKASIADPSVAEVRAIDDGILVTALKAGRTDLTLWTDAGIETIKIKVRENKSSRLLSQVEDFLGERPGLKLRTAGNKVLIEGMALRSDDLVRALTAAKMFKGVKCLARLHPDVLELVANAMRAELTAMGYGHLRAKPIGGKLYLKGTVASKEEKEKVLEVAHRFDPFCVDMLRIGIRYQRQILTDLKIAEVNIDSGLDIGMRWKDSIAFSGTAMASTSSNAAQISVEDYGAVLKMLKTKGWGRLLANPKLVSRNGVPAHIMVGGEIPIRIVGERTAEVMFKQYGISMDVTPTIGQGGVISLTINTEISSIDNSRNVEGIPGLIKKDLNTSVNLRDGETLVLGGLLSESAGKDVEKVPLLGHIPILGELFKSRRFRENKSKLLFFLTPRVIDPADEINRKIIREIENDFKRLGKKLTIRVLD